MLTNTQPNKRASWDFPELSGKTLPLTFSGSTSTFWAWNFLQPSCYMSESLSEKEGNQKQAESRDEEKNSCQPLLNPWIRLNTKVAWPFESLSDVRKTFPFLPKLIWIVFLSFAMARVLTITALSFDWLMWQSRIIFFLLSDPSHRKQNSSVPEWALQHNLLPQETIILLYSICVSPVKV